ncbi:hypothetical protein RP726_19180 [Candidatus Methylospira mobilis]|uniref:hypothetical protein n=1 Tax=Candidatus Methylospira mobilis TaxID=1808979 RepID=UPI0028ED74B3|nr:hypothetical protein [Candidatus Methylospira mobilis]WNV04495.1 hypothetical protein RP726_19180 [Candidatus Methylospira mobilis]
MRTKKYRSIFSPATYQEKIINLVNYWVFTRQHAGQLFEEDRDLEKKRDRLLYFKNNPVSLRKPLADHEAFYRNYVSMKDDPRSLDRLTLMLTSIYKFSRNELVVVTAAWDVVPNMANSRNIEDKISRVHLAEEFCHWRLFDEMLRTCGLDRVEWKSLSPVKDFIYLILPKLHRHSAKRVISKPEVSHENYRARNESI